MPATEVSADALVTDHAALRYLERVLDVDVGPQAISRAEDRAQLKKACVKLGTTPTVVKNGIATQSVRAALAAGAEGVLRGGVWIVFQHGRIATILPPAMRFQPLSKKAKNPRRRRAEIARQRERFSPQVPARPASD